MPCTNRSTPHEVGEKTTARAPESGRKSVNAGTVFWIVPSGPGSAGAVNNAVGERSPRGPFAAVASSFVAAQPAGCAGSQKVPVAELMVPSGLVTQLTVTGCGTSMSACARIAKPALRCASVLISAPACIRVIVFGSNAGTTGVGNVSLGAPGLSHRNERVVWSAFTAKSRSAAGGNAPAPTAPVSNAPCTTSAVGAGSSTSNTPFVSAMPAPACHVKRNGVVGVLA